MAQSILSQGVGSPNFALQQIDCIFTISTLTLRMNEIFDVFFLKFLLVDRPVCLWTPRHRLFLSLHREKTTRSQTHKVPVIREMVTFALNILSHWSMCEISVITSGMTKEFALFYFSSSFVFFYCCCFSFEWRVSSGFVWRLTVVRRIQLARTTPSAVGRVIQIAWLSGAVSLLDDFCETISSSMDLIGFENWFYLKLNNFLHSQEYSVEYYMEEVGTIAFLEESWSQVLSHELRMS